MQEQRQHQTFVLRKLMPPETPMGTVERTCTATTGSARKGREQLLAGEDLFTYYKIMGQ